MSVYTFLQNKLRSSSLVIISAVLGAMLGGSLAAAATTINTNVQTDGTLSVTGISTLTGAVTAASTLNVTGATTLVYASSTQITASSNVYVGGIASTSQLIVGGDNSTSGATINGFVSGVCTIPNTTGITASTTKYIDCTATGVRAGDKVFVQATSSLPVEFVIEAASSSVAATINLRVVNLGYDAVTTLTPSTINFWAVR